MTHQIKQLIQHFIFNSKKRIIKIKNKNIILGPNVKIDFNSRIYTKGNELRLGKDVYLRSNPKGYHAGMPYPTTILLDKPGAICHIGDSCRINGSYIHAEESIIIGENTVIAAGTNIIDSNGHETISLNRTKGRDIPTGITIGKNVWIGLNSTILKGTVIRENSIVAAGSIVKGNFPKNSLIQGNPAKTVKILNIGN